jgi:glutamyl-tRNA(Gln) amidotransferase subunit E
MSASPFKPFTDMRPEDYAAAGFRSGLEIHQQLLTDRKLFCRCPAGRYSHSYDAEILRHMRPTLSELGEYDGTALMEFKTKKEIIYRINRETVCTYEMDDTPPFELNEEALEIALGVALLYGCSMVDEIHIARKQYLDGSIPTGFQRTTIVGVDGSVPFRGREIPIVQLGLEEDSCREVSDVGHRRTYITDRLGMPLIETVTAPAMRTPQEVAEVGDLLRRIVRSTGRVRTGMGAARQDVNVSVTGGTRIEIKGVPRLRAVPLLTYNEAMRQWNLLRLKEELERRGVTTATFASSTDDVTRFLKRTRYQPISGILESGGVVLCVTLRGFRGALAWQTQTGTVFSREISDRVRVIACLTTLPNIIHSDSPSETLSASEWQSIRKAVGAGTDDTCVLVWGDPVDAPTGAREITIRAREVTIGVPSETRQALRDGTNGFERILPGPDRMYPDTDLPPKRITAERLGRIRTTLPQPIWKLEAWYEELGLPADVIRPLAVSGYAPLFERAVKEWKSPPVLAAVALVQWVKRIVRAGGDAARLSPDALGRLLETHAAGKLAAGGVYAVMRGLASDGMAADASLPVPASDAEIRAAIAAVDAQLAGMSIRKPARRKHLRMGMIMDRLRGRVDGRKIQESEECRV